MLVALPLDLAPTITNVYLLGHEFLKVVFTDLEAVSFMLKASPLQLEHWILMPFSLGFDPMLEDRCVTYLFIIFLGLSQIYHQLLATRSERHFVWS